MADEAADVIVVGAGLAGLVAAAELTDAGRRVILLDQEPEQSLGGQAFWSFGGLFFVNSPEQRRLGIRDTRDLALQDWMGSAAFDREEDAWPRKWAEAYVDFAAGEKRAWLHAQGVRFFPVVGWAERGGYLATGHGNSVPRFHITWGTGPGLIEPFVRRLREAEKTGRISLRFRHRVNELTASAGQIDGVAGEILEPSDAERGAPTSRAAIGEFALKAQAVIVTSGGIGGDHDAGAETLAGASGQAAQLHALGRARLCRWPDAGDRRSGGRQRHQPRPHVALYGRRHQLCADLEPPRHPHPAGAVTALVRRDRQAPARAAVSRLRHARHIAASDVDRA